MLSILFLHRELFNNNFHMMSIGMIIFFLFKAIATWLQNTNVPLSISLSVIDFNTFDLNWSFEFLGNEIFVL